jgi:hypothetical protein
VQCLGCFPVTRAKLTADALGISPAEVRRLVRDGTLTRIRQGVLVGSCHLERAAGDARATHVLKLRAQLAVYPECVASHESATLVAGLPLLAIPETPRIIRTHGAWRGGDDVRVRIAPLPDGHVYDEGGVRATTMPRTTVDIARGLAFRDAVVVMDAVLRHCPHGVIAAVIDECAEWAEVGKAGRVLAFADPRSESALESVSRAEMHERGLPAPQPQAWVRGVSGKRYRVDFWWGSRRLIGEADGAEKYTDRAAVFAEKRREDDLREAGCSFVRWTYVDMVANPEATVQRIARHLAR